MELAERLRLYVTCTKKAISIGGTVSNKIWKAHPAQWIETTDLKRTERFNSIIGRILHIAEKNCISIC
jgi:hypothetical protein